MVSASQVFGFALVGTAGFLLLSGGGGRAAEQPVLDRAPPAVPQFGRIFGLGQAGQAPFVTPPPKIVFNAPEFSAPDVGPVEAPVQSSGSARTSSSSSIYAGLEGGFSVAPDSDIEPNVSFPSGPAYVPPPSSKKDAESEGPMIENIYSGVDNWRRALPNGGGAE